MNINIHDERYSRQVLLPEIGVQGQELLAGGRVLVVGAGGLGCPLLQYLAAAGVGYIGIVDGDVVSLTNLHRQVLYGIQDVEQLKVKAAAKALHHINPDVQVKQYPFFLNNVLALELLPKYDIVVDCTDNFATRYLLNDACGLLQKPLVMAALTQWEGQLAVLHAAVNGAAGIDYRDIFPEPPGKHEVPNCAQAGVLGVLPGIMGTLQASEVIKYLTGVGELLSSCMLLFDLKKSTSWIMGVTRSNKHTGPADKQAFLHTNYEWYCGARDVVEISTRELPVLMERGAVFIDVREHQERPDLPVPNQRLPLSELRNRQIQVKGKDVVVVCHHGIRSVEAVRLLSQWAPAGQKLYSLKGGIMALSAFNQSK